MRNRVFEGEVEENVDSGMRNGNNVKRADVDRSINLVKQIHIPTGSQERTNKRMTKKKTWERGISMLDIE